ncbi:MAG: GMC family oxidoreductase [Candidatus Binatia bacterium]
MASSDIDHDVIIVGSGAGGGTLAHRLASTGLRILLLERGHYVPREPQNWDSAAVAAGRYNTDESWRDAGGNDFRPATFSCVGGNTKFYGAALLRMRREDFGEVRHRDGVSPAWPISYEEIERYYGEAERLYRVHGQRGTDPTEPPASTPYAHRPVAHEPRIEEIVDGLRAVGARPFPIPIGLMIDDADPHAGACIRCGTCDGFPCRVDAKADTQVICVDPALRHPNVTLLTGAFVSRLETSPSGREITGVVVEREGATERHRGHVVVVAAGAIHSAALLLRSASDRHPRGLANGSDQVGRNYMCHVNSMLLAITRHANPTRLNKTMGLNDFYFGGRDDEFPLGHVSLVGNIDGHFLARGAPRVVPRRALDWMAAHAVPFWLMTEDLPRAGNRVTLDPDGTVRLAYAPNNEESHRRLTARMKSLLSAIERRHRHRIPFEAFVPARMPLAGAGHQNGTVRFGRSRETSVLDTDCRAHEVDNLYVVDGGFFPSSAAVNPALTIIANALRVGDHLMARFGVERAREDTSGSAAR